ncbi:RabGAP/TBC [Fomitiporia mediterranea MF3/22]|uniref:RabGAP/TBC n=1 Tax=Fomitiporia mediterranea (strain MF3/22) TaxID=694068 RepID=UPI0004408E49|nr:RabGAP/TBC [Fomitiporia mediterranea MF3/22]EJD02386.1 RabGAP/TBC [Fomitiporia mediterranea MF3/22]
MKSPQSSKLSFSTVSDESMVEIKREEVSLGVSDVSEDENEKYRLLYSKSKVYVHPTAYAKDNIPGFVTLVKREAVNPKYLLAWIPESLLNEKGKDEWDKFVKIEERTGLDDEDEDVVLIDLPVRRPETYAFSVPLTSVYSLIVHPPTLTSWHGSIAVNLTSGSTLPTLYFHDEESRSFSTSPISPPINQAGSGSSTTTSSYPPRVIDSGARAPGLTTWGGEDLLARLRQYAHLLRSNLQSTLFLVDPSKADIETHTMQLFDDDAVDDILARSSYANSYSPVPAHRRPRPLSSASGSTSSSSNGNGSNPYSERSSVLHRSLHPPSPPNSGSQARTALLHSFAQLTRATRHAAQQILSHPLAQPIVPHLPDPVKSIVNASGETQWGSWVEKGGVGEFDSARVYLARWARIVAEEGERARQREVRAIPVGTGASTPSDSRLDEDGELGVFELLHTSANLPKPRSTRDPRHPIDEETWLGWFQADGRPRVREEEMRKEVFRRGISPRGNLRKRIWPFILGVLEWDADDKQRAEQWEEKQTRYHELKDEWCGVDEVFNRQDVIEERHRIDVDCRRTDRTQPLFITHSPNSSPSSSPGQENNASRVHRRYTSFSPSPFDHGAQAPSNDHIERLAEILLTYNFYEKQLGYVQGMSDLCAPIYVVMGGDEEMIFWCFVEVMNRMKQNFLRDQSGMKKQLLTLQQLISVMDPELYRHLEKTDGLNLFFCFRWVLIAFKREFPFDDVLKLWEVLWTDYYSANFVLFVALAILESHRDVILRYLIEFDEILKYCNELSMTIELDTTLAQAEVLFISFTQLVADIDRRKAENDFTVTTDVNAIRNRRRKQTGSEATVNGRQKSDDGSSDSTEVGRTTARNTTISLPSIGENLRELLENGR